MQSPAGRAEVADVHPGWARLGAAAFLAGNSMALSLAINLAEASQHERWAIHIGLAFAAALVAGLVGKPLARAALLSLRERQAGVEALFLSALCGAAVLSAVSVWQANGPVYFEVVGLLLVIFAWGQKLKSTSQMQVMRSLRDQVPLSRRCRRLDPNTDKTLECLLSDIRAGDLVQLSPLDVVPVDGIVVKGRAFYSTASLTGEGFCTTLDVGAHIYAGTQVIDAHVVFQATTDAQHSQLDIMTRDILNGLLDRSTWEYLAERWAKRVLPIALSVSFATFAYWSCARSLQIGLLNAMAVLLVACPCALSFATPTAVWASVIVLARLGLYTRNTSAIERLAQIDTLIFDKTGTLTEMTTGVQTWVFSEECSYTPAQIKALASAAQRLSSHPIAKAFAGSLGGSNEVIQPTQVFVHPGIGVTVALIHQNAKVNIFLGEASSSLDKCQMRTWSLLASRLDPALRAVCIIIDGTVAAAAGLSDNVATDIRQLWGSASQHHLMTHIYSGDTQARVDSLGHPSARGQMSPVDKKSSVECLQREGRLVCFIGDGINDAPAMAVSHVSMAIDAGATLAADASDFILPQARICNIYAAVAVARRMHDIIKSNLRIAVWYNALAISVAALGLLHPAFAAFMMLASSLTVTLRVARLMNS